MSILEEHIEQAIQTRNLNEVRRLISQLLAIERYSPTSRYTASEYLRRISDYRGALKILKTEIDIPQFSKISPHEQKNQLQLARLLNLLGASSISLRILSRVPEKIRRQHSKQVTSIYLSNFFCDEALCYLPSYKNLQFKKLNHGEKLDIISLADALMGTQQYDVAEMVLEKLYEETKEPLLQGIIQQVLGANALHQNEIVLAEKHLGNAQKLFNPEDPTHDHGYLLKWIGVLLLKKSDTTEALTYLNRALKILHRPGFKPETWLDVLYYIGLYKKNSLNSNKIPTEWLRYLAYPSPRKKHTVAILKPISKVYFSYSSITKQPLKNCLSPDDFQYSQLDQLHSQLIIAGKYGIPQFRLYDLLWPDETFSFLQFQTRLDQILFRLRKNVPQIRYKKTHLWGALSEKTCTLWQDTLPVKGKKFLLEHQNFCRKEIENYFNISPRSALNLCHEWENKKLIKKSAESGPASRYQVINFVDNNEQS